MIGSMMMCLSAVLLAIGMIAGIAMGIEQNFLLAPAHAHLNLIGGVLLFLIGLYYRLSPEVGATRLAQIQGGLHMVGAVLFPAGIAVTLLNAHAYKAAPVVGSLLVLASFILFAIVVFRDALSRRALGTARPRPQLQPYPWHSQGVDSRRSGAPNA
jgi:hypothetical protein